jgi:uncharacterized phiE125 gp8 family phage protein
MGVVAMDPPAPPVSVAEAKAFLRIAASEEDAVLAGLVRSAAELCESFTGRALVVRPVREVLAGTGGWVRLSAAPVQAIEAVAQLAEDGGRTVLALEDYAVDVDAAGDGWVRLPRGMKRIEVSYRAGLAVDANQVPEALRQGIVRLAGHLYAHRSGGAEGGPPAAVTALWRPWRRVRL